MIPSYVDDLQTVMGILSPYLVYDEVKTVTVESSDVAVFSLQVVFSTGNEESCRDLQDEFLQLPSDALYGAMKVSNLGRILRVDIRSAA